MARLQKAVKMKLKVGDQIIVTTGKHKGQTGSIKKVLPKLNKVLIEGVNLVVRHQKPSQLQEVGGIVKINKPIEASNVAILEPDSQKPSRIGYKIESNGRKVRIYKRTNSPISNQSAISAGKGKGKRK